MLCDSNKKIISCTYDLQNYSTLRKTKTSSISMTLLTRGLNIEKHLFYLNVPYSLDLENSSSSFKLINVRKKKKNVRKNNSEALLKPLGSLLLRRKFFRGFTFFNVKDINWWSFSVVFNLLQVAEPLMQLHLEQCLVVSDP